ncbi:alcohol dehydrogenase [Alteromonas aestuariivivens]|uniref:Alcohol dehydrogenase n=1 Tax=Alteromonas aestuariivivens TaxID=1938339 RepID=A0A3D8ME93_9ALTE|nr:zinc-binding dehydrogenase [Alteromonas aestuariivivens]RDV28920.1 alcohol dehydrogenase [Alteromonas aestuariivivens]
MTSMKSIAMQGGKIYESDIDLPTPGPGQVRVKSLACGICGSDLHITRHSSEVFGIYKKMGIMPQDADDQPEVRLGHEFCAEVDHYGPQTEGKFAIGSRVTCVPVLATMGGAGVGVTPGLHGAYSEYFIVDEALLLPVPDDLPAAAAAITEPLAVGLHAVNRATMHHNEVALVAGCGPIGLAAIAALKLQGVKHIVASDPQASKRDSAMEFGATHCVDPTQDDEVRIASELAAGNRVVIFECVGIHQLINGFIERAPAHSTLIITGIHTAESKVNFGYATVKEMDIRFSYYYSPEEFAESLENIVEGKIDWQAMCTGKVGIDGVSAAFDTLMKPNDHIKVIIEPWRSGELEPF